MKSSRWTSRLLALAESLLWTAWSLLSQVVVLVVFMGVLMLNVFGFRWPDPETLQQVALDSNLDRSFLLLGVTSLGAVFLIVPCVFWRLGREARNLLGTHWPRRDQLVFALATVTPVAIVSDLVYEIAQQQWISLTTESASHPLAFLTMAELHQRFQGVPYPILVVAMALGPAICEELVFRGLIGRRLIATWGVVPGVLLTSLLFAAAHISPAHAVGTIPIALMLHWLYLQTRTIWIPIIVHFCNNVLAITLVRFHLAEGINIPPQAILALLVYLGFILALLHIRERTGTLSWPVLQKQD